MRTSDRRKFLATSAMFGGSLFATSLFAQEPQDGITEPVFRIADAGKKDAPVQPTGHELDPALKLARDSLQHIRTSIKDYTAIMVKREQIDGVLGDYEYLGVKVRNRQVENGRIVVPFSVYLTFLAPATVKGREVIYVENQNSGKIIAHEGGMKGRFIPTVTLDPHGMMAMRGQRYPITDMGIENLVVKLIEKGERDRKQGPCTVRFSTGAKVDKRDCTVLSVQHDNKLPCFDFHLAQIYIDNELNIPVRYLAYDWPRVPGGEKVLLEEYTYMKIKTNVGLTDQDFDRENTKYRF